jgi:tripartite-type tricarboxylate transporter receptor subunit TctC
MKIQRRRFLHQAAGVAALPALSRIARAQTYPTRSITMNVAFAAGGALDTTGRILAERMRVSLGQRIIIENVTGAAGSIGVGRVARAPADGYTVSIGSVSTHVFNGAIYALPYDVLMNFEPIALVATNPMLIVAKKAMPANNLKDFIAWLKANPGRASQGTFGAGSVGHIVGIFFQNTTGTRYQFVPYRGGPPAMQDLVAGQIDMMIDNPVTSLPQIRAGGIKGYVVTAKNRLAQAPEIPTADEAGLPGLYVTNWQALFVPKGTPKDVVAKLNAAVVEALADPAVRNRISDQGFEIPPPEQQTPEWLAVLHKAEIEKWWPIIKAANIKGE